MSSRWHRGARGFAAALILAACGGDDGAPRPDAAEMRRRFPLVMAALDRTPQADADPTVLTCILDDPYDQAAYQLGFDGVDPVNSIVADVVACSADEWDELPQAIATLHGVDVALVAPLVAVAVAAVED